MRPGRRFRLSDTLDEGIGGGPVSHNAVPQTNVTPKSSHVG